ncbi:MAG: TauD/TfdA family dioxygenase [Gammaproteobacteria bacterium]|nr:TauD/TfdA family dioxygenase [Gammaproteobacteria bacterium]
MNAGRVYRHVEVEPLTPTIGATLHGVDLARPLSDDAFEEIHAAWMAHQVIFLRDQHISAEQHLAFGRRFGELHIHPAAPYAHGNPELMMIHTDKESFRQNGAGWHSDVSADEEPPLGSILHLETVPKHGGDTLFASMYEAYDALSEPMRTLLDGLTARHESDYTGQYGDHKPQREFPKASHPVIRTHPVTGRKALFVNAGFTRRIEGLSRTESRALLDFLFEHIKNPAFQCRFQWQAHSIAMWDNRCVQHVAIWDYYPQTRSGIRVTVKGDRPFH